MFGPVVLSSKLWTDFPICPVFRWTRYQTLTRYTSHQSVHALVIRVFLESSRDRKHGVPSPLAFPPRCSTALIQISHHCLSCRFDQWMDWRLSVCRRPACWYSTWLQIHLSCSGRLKWAALKDVPSRYEAKVILNSREVKLRYGGQTC